MKSTILLLLITLFGFLIRTWKISEIPAILNRDEAALAYNALLLKQTGKDEWQRSWPLTLESFGDYKLIGYPLLLVGLFSILPAEDWVVKIPSLFAGTLLIPLSCLFSRKVGIHKRYSVLVAALIATTPVFFFYSRIAFEANVALTLFISVIYLWWDSKSKPASLKKDLLGTVILLISLATYNTPLLLSPLLIVMVLWQRHPVRWRKWILPVSLTILFMLSMLKVQAELAAQKSGITIFSDETVWRNSVAYRLQFPTEYQSIIGNKYVYYALLISKNVVASFSPQFLAIRGGTHPWHTVAGFGMLLWPVYIASTIGIGITLVSVSKSILKRRLKVGSNSITLLGLVCGSLFPSIITVDSPHATRSLLFVFMLVIFAGVGIQTVLERCRPLFKSTLVIAFLISWIGISYYYLNSYYIRYPLDQPESLFTGYAKVVQQAARRFPNTPMAVVDEDGFQYIVTAWYLKMPAQDFFDTVIRQQPNTIGFRYGQQVGNFHFIFKAGDRAEDEKIVLLRKDKYTWVIFDHQHGSEL